MGGYYNLSGFKTGKTGTPPKPAVTGTDGQGNPLTLEAFAESTFGFLRITVSAQSILLEALGVDEQSGKISTLDSTNIGLGSQIAASGSATVRRASGSHKPKPRPPARSAPTAKKKGKGR